MSEHKVIGEAGAKPAQQPSVGRVVHYTPGNTEQQMAGYDEPGAKFAALVCYVHPDSRYVNLVVFDAQGVAHPRVAVAPLVEEAGVGPCGRWSWPAFVPPKPAG